MAKAVEACVHCGMCLPACPTYQLLGQEMDSPRGRIVLMKEALESKIPVGEMLPHVDRCLGCVSCVTACPSGVEYGQLVNSFRAFTKSQIQRPVLERLLHLLIHSTLPHPSRLRMIVRATNLLHPLHNLLTGRLAAMVNLLPDRLPQAEPLPAVYPAQGRRRAQVALLAGCVQQVLAPEINWATLRVLAHNGVEVVVPSGQGCCGALALHTGDTKRARTLSRNNLEVFPTDVDAIISNAAGCGSGICDYMLLFKDKPELKEATKFSHSVKDVSVFLDELGVQTPTARHTPLKLAYHDPCHLAHAQGIREAPRNLLQHIPNLSLHEVANGEICCGSAGTYNIEQPEIANELGKGKARNVITTGAEGVVTGNIGCIVQIRTHLAALGHPLPVSHTMEVLDRAYGTTTDTQTQGISR